MVYRPEAQLPDVVEERITSVTLIATAYGELSRRSDLLGSSAAVDLYSVFLARSELMGWSRLGSSKSPAIPPLWVMEEAELTADHEDQIGFAQVGLDVNVGTPESVDHVILEEPPPGADPFEGEWAPAPLPIDADPPIDPVIAIPPMIQCLDDSLRRFGDATVKSYQVTVDYMPAEHHTQLYDLVSMHNWFRVAKSKPRSQAVATIAVDQWDEDQTAEVVSCIAEVNLGSFEMAQLLALPAEYAVEVEWEPSEWKHAATGLMVSMIEWTPGASGWVIAMIYDVVLSLDQVPRHLSVKLSRSI